jgi:hypothetical protein
VSKTSSHYLETCEWGRHVDSFNRHDVSWSTLLTVNTSYVNLHSSRYVTNGNLITWLLNFDLLETNESAAFDLHHQLPFVLVLDALCTGAFEQRSELF